MPRPPQLQESESEAQSDSESSNDEEAPVNSQHMAQHAYFCCKCAERAPAAGGQERGVQFFDSIRAVQGHINRRSQCRHWNYAEVERVVRSTDVAAGGVGKGKGRKQARDEGFVDASPMAQPGIASIS
jgi:hypothetical protein